MKKGYEIIVEDVNTGDIKNVYYKKKEDKAKELFFKYFMEYRVILNEFDEEYGTTTNLLDNADYWELKKK